MDPRIVGSNTLQWTTADWFLLPSGILDETEELANYVKVALLTDALAGVDEVLPDPDSDDRRGWWGDFEAAPIWHGWPIGTKNWLLTRAKITGPSAWEGDTAVRAQNYTRNALQPLIGMKLCSKVDVLAARSGPDQIDVLVRVWRGPYSAIDLIFQDLWNQMRIEEVYSPYAPPPPSAHLYLINPYPYWVQSPRFATPRMPQNPFKGGVAYTLSSPSFAAPAVTKAVANHKLAAAVYSTQSPVFIRPPMGFF